MTMISTATPSAAISVNVIICAQTSDALAGRVLRAGERHVSEPADVRPGVQ